MKKKIDDLEKIEIELKYKANEWEKKYNNLEKENKKMDMY